MRSQVVFSFIFYLFMENMYPASTWFACSPKVKKHRAGLLHLGGFDVRDGASNQLASRRPGRQLCAEGTWWAGWWQAVAMGQGGGWPSLSCCLGESLLPDGFHCQQGGFALSLLADKGALKGDSAAPKVNFS